MNNNSQTSILNFVNIGERTNVTGSSKFKKLIFNNDYEKLIVSNAKLHCIFDTKLKMMKMS